MKLIFDDTVYHVDLSKVVEADRQIYQAVRTNGLQLKDGTIVQMNDRSIMRTALKMIMTPIVLPLLRNLYASKDIILDPPPKHTDLIDYAVHAFLDYCAILEKRLEVNLTSKTSENSGNTVESIATTWTSEPVLELPSFTENSEND